MEKLVPTVLPRDCQVLAASELHSNGKNQFFQCLSIKTRVQTRIGTYNVAGFTVGFLLHGIERLSPQLVVALHTGEAFHVEDLVHGCAASAFPNNILPTAGTAACHQTKRTWVKAHSSPQLQRKSFLTPVTHSEKGTMAAQSTEEQFVPLLAKIQCWSTWNDLQNLETSYQDCTDTTAAARRLSSQEPEPQVQTTELASNPQCIS